MGATSELYSYVSIGRKSTYPIPGESDWSKPQQELAQVQFPGNRTGRPPAASEAAEQQQPPEAAEAACGGAWPPPVATAQQGPLPASAAAILLLLWLAPVRSDRTGARDRMSNMVPSVASQSRLLFDPWGIGLEPAKAGTTFLLLWLAPVRFPGDWTGMPPAATA
ncbi:hypothetical protein PCANC_03174 [Puccinia coronata f. sp. avenae]|uniref:Uncharacterized protein n=1 Tax=Puccinia coronata f. sp. avenae TaxID=200324 RepID=A0A2N5T858_9BASI|nr:hypothetical protein PCANC_03174 [Puccinia coronata f. sp. avenae]